ncbi:hypothetical protein Plim_1261 [Planctopirus limnophila DSM 3776]|uniref:Uncharacterized protein n=1 Tax=Planctopirus limnophila (strain ATCC 43296 / DSM 3776 / IFAM 1008 / Mu 290) TaxID=521674 RepID=D5SUP3_PLAL2|nr:hypothetical protein Plim_1261 [Planctopirus limnophila DSM 3776]
MFKEIRGMSWISVGLNRLNLVLKPENALENRNVNPKSVKLGKTESL